MSLHHDLLAQAHHLATVDRTRPKQVNLRRAVSSAYYALFHLLTTSAAALFAGDSSLATKIARTLNHGDMRKASQQFANSRLPRAILPSSGAYSTPSDLQFVAETLVTLQQVRHEADYDLTRVFGRRETLELVQRSRDAFSTWERIKKTNDARLYLACFLLYKRWDEDPR